MLLTGCCLSLSLLIRTFVRVPVWICDVHFLKNYNNFKLRFILRVTVGACLFPSTYRHSLPTSRLRRNSPRYWLCRRFCVFQQLVPSCINPKTRGLSLRTRTTTGTADKAPPNSSPSDCKRSGYGSYGLGEKKFWNYNWFLLHRDISFYS